MEITGMILSSGFRKALESHWSSLACITTRNLPDWFWTVFMDDIREHFDKTGLTRRSLLQYAHKIDWIYLTSKNEFEYRHARQIDRDMIMMFCINMRTLSLEDAEALVDWVKYCNKQMGENDDTVIQ